MNEGGVILYPTDTVWGIGCDATNEEAVRRVYEIKKRADSKAMLVLVDSPVKVDFYVQDVPDVAWDLIEVADKPLTIIYSGARNLATNLLAEDGSVEIPGCIRNGISEEAAEAIFADMESFAQYAFNKSHAAVYAVVAYETGYLKKYYPVEFMAALIADT